jgi:hypothetical protein
MKKFQVIIPVSGYIVAVFEAENEEAAKEAALEKAFTVDDIDEWNTHEYICKGNVVDCMQREMEIEEVRV